MFIYKPPYKIKNPIMAIFWHITLCLLYLFLEEPHPYIETIVTAVYKQGHLVLGFKHTWVEFVRSWTFCWDPYWSGHSSSLGWQWQRYSAQRTKRHAIFHGTAISHSSHYAIIPHACLKFMTMAFGYVPQGRGGCRIVTRPLFLLVRGGVWAWD